MFSDFCKKNLGGLIVFIFLLNLAGAVLIFPKKTKAFDYATEHTQVTHTTSNIGFKIDQMAHNKLIEIKEYVLDGLAWTMANVIIDQFGDALVTWIQNGFEGSPMFLSDPEEFFKDTANQMSGAIIDQMDLEWLCKPLGKLNIDIDFFFPGTSRNEYACTFEDVVANFERMANRGADGLVDVDIDINQENVVQRFGDDFRNGSWLTWLASADPKNNVMGRTLVSADAAYTAARVNVEMGKFNLNLNSGFFGVRKCVEHREAYDTTGNKVNGDCKKWITQTPGQLVQDQLKDVGGKDMSRLQVADEIDEIIGALATTMMGWLLTGGNDGEGVLGYDKDADYSGTNRDHYGELSKSQQLAEEKRTISGQISKFTEWEEKYGEALEVQSDALYGAKEKMETILAKLNCIYATSIGDTAYDYSTCTDEIQEIGKKLEPLGKTSTDVNSDRNSVQTALTGDVYPRISEYESRYDTQTFVDGDTFQSLDITAVDASIRALELVDLFEEEVMLATKAGEIKTLKDEEHYCYDYNKRGDNVKGKQTAQICGLFGDDAASGELGVKVTAERNPVVSDASNGFTSTTKIYWKAVNAEQCSTVGGEKTWRDTIIGTSGSYTVTPLKSDETRTYGIKCYDQDNNRMDQEITLAAAESNAEPASIEMLTDRTAVEINTSTNIYWLSGNTSSCYLYSDKDNLDESAYAAAANSLGVNGADSDFFAGEGYYRKEKTNSTKKTATGLISGNTNYKIICRGNDGEIASEEMTISTIESEKKTYQTHSEKEWKDVNEEAQKIEEKMDAVVLKYACLLNEYTQDENISADECAEANQTSSASP